MPVWFQSIIVLLIVWVLARVIKRNTPVLHRYFIPSSIVGGFLLLLLGHQALGIIPAELTDSLSILPALLINVVFAGLFLGQKTPGPREIWRSSAPMIAFGSTIAWGMYVVGILLTLLILGPFFGAPPIFGALLEISLSGGHGTAAGLAPTFASLGYEQMTDVALGLATLSIVTAVIFGIATINIYNRRIGRILDRSTMHAQQKRMIKNGYDLTRVTREFETKPRTINSTILLFVMAIGLGWLILHSLIWLENIILGDTTDIRVFVHLPLFPLAMFGGLILQLILHKLRLDRLVDISTVRTFSAIALDLLIITAIGTMSLNIIGNNFASFAILATVGISWIIFCFFFLAPKFFRKHWFEYGLTDTGQALGMTATGLLLNRLADPLNRTGARQGFAYKQLAYEPFLGGGIVTSVAVVAIVEFGQIPVLVVATTAMLFWLIIGLRMGSGGSRARRRQIRIGSFVVKL